MASVEASAVTLLAAYVQSAKLTTSPYSRTVSGLL